jgi:hypothetical protein
MRERADHRREAITIDEISISRKDSRNTAHDSSRVAKVSPQPFRGVPASWLLVTSIDLRIRPLLNSTLLRISYDMHLFSL